jgi:hypothetical protein
MPSLRLELFWVTVKAAIGTVCTRPAKGDSSMFLKHPVRPGTGWANTL